MARYVVLGTAAAPPAAPRPSGDETGAVSSVASVSQRLIAWMFPPPVTLRDVSQAQVKRLREPARVIERRIERRRREVADLTRDLKRQLQNDGEPNVRLARQLLRQRQFIEADEKRLEVVRALQHHVETLADAVDLKKAMTDATSLVTRVNTYLSPQRAERMTRAFQKGMQTNASVGSMLEEAIDAVADDEADETEATREADGDEAGVSDLIEQMRAAADLESKAEDAKRARLHDLRRQHEALTVAVPEAAADAPVASVEDAMLALRFRELTTKEGRL